MKDLLSFGLIIMCLNFYSCNNESSVNQASESDNGSPQGLTIEDFPELDQSLKGVEETGCKFNSVFQISDYEDEGVDDLHPNFLYVDLEMMGNVGVDLDDIEGKIFTESGTEVDTWMYDCFFLDENGRPTEESDENCNKDYTHIGLIMPCPEKPKRLELWYWGGLMCPSDVLIEKETAKLPE